MKNNSKRICALLLAIVMCIGCVVPVFAVEASGSSSTATCPGEGVYHTKDNCTIVPDSAKKFDPGCGVLGYTKYTCAGCGKDFLDDWVPALDGCVKTVVAHARTCEEDGWLEVYCETHNKESEIRTSDAVSVWNALRDKNGNTYNRADYVAQGHALSEVITSGNPCTGDSYVSYKECDNCDYKTEETELEALGHMYELVEFTVRPTCLTDGEAKYVCKREGCGDVKLVKVLKTSSLAEHTYDADDVVAKEGKAPTCAVEGEGTVNCEVCGELLTVVMPKTGEHDGYTAVIEAQEATCTEDGHTAGKACGICGAADPENTSETITAPGHAYGTLVPQVDADCDSEGMKAHYFCDVCDTYFDENKVATTEAALKIAIKHNWGDTPTVSIAPTCTTFGFDIYACTLCGDLGTVNNEQIGEGGTLAATGVVRYDKLGHEFDVAKDATIVEGPVGKTCTTDGYTVYKCARCDETYREVDEADGHVYVPVETVATCQSEGYWKDVCDCGEVRIDTEGANGTKTDAQGRYNVSPKNERNHEVDWSTAAASTPATCQRDGILLGWCPYCEIWDEETIPQLSHSYDKVDGTDVSATCTEGAYYMEKCVNGCGDTRKHYTSEALGHSFTVLEYTVNQDCYANGYDVYSCANGDCTETEKDYTVSTETFAETTVVSELKYPKYSHVSEFRAEITYPVCTAPETDGYYTHYCKKCEEIVASGETTASIYGTSNAYDVYSYKGASIPFDETNHLHHTAEGPYADTLYHNGVKYDTPELADAAAGGEANGIYRIGTCSKSELRDYYCTDCEHQFYVRNVGGQNYGEVTTPEEHEGFVLDVAASELTCTSDGKTLGWHCTVCGESETSVTTPATGHVFGEINNGSSATCTTTGVTAHYVCTVCGEKHLTNDAFSTAKKTDAELTIPTTDHNYGTLVARDPATCVNTGMEEHYVCADCGKYFTSDKVETTVEDLTLEVVPHTMTVIEEVEVTCTELGYKRYYCSACGKATDINEDVDYIDGYHVAKGHNDNLTTVPGQTPTCITPGYTESKVCPDCDVIIVPATPLEANHYNSDGDVIKAECDKHLPEAERITNRVCVTCGEEIPAHSYVITKYPATCVQYEYELKVCTACGEWEATVTREEYGEHADVRVDTANSSLSTCVTPGVKVIKCFDCGEQISSETLPLANHRYASTWTVTTPAELGVAGSKEKACQNAGCTEKQTEAIPALTGIKFTYSYDNAVKSGMHYVNTGKIALTITYDAYGVDVNNIILTLKYAPEILSYSNADLLCEGFNIANCEVGGSNEAGKVSISARANALTETENVNVTLSGTGKKLAVVYFDILPGVLKNTPINITAVTSGDGSSVLVNKDSQSIASSVDVVDIDDIDSITVNTYRLGDAISDGEVTGTDAVHVFNIMLGSADYCAEADIDQNGTIDLNDYLLIKQFSLNSITYDQMCSGDVSEAA